MPSLHSLSCKNLGCLGAYYSRAQAGPAHGCLAVAVMFRNQLTTLQKLCFNPTCWPCPVANIFSQDKATNGCLQNEHELMRYAKIDG